MSYKFKVSDVKSDIGNSTVNQDCGFVKENTLAVFDGHSTYGKELAEVSSEVFESSDSDFNTLFNTADQACMNKLKMVLSSKGIVYHEHQGCLYRSSGSFYEPSTSIHGGTTATIVRLDPETGKLNVANVGDSEAMFFDSDTEDGITMTSDHTPTSEDEWLRIESMYTNTKFLFCNPKNLYPPRQVWVPDGMSNWKLNPLGGYQYCDVRNGWASYVSITDVGTIAMTRAIGDFAYRKHGVICRPDMDTFDPPTTGVTRAVVLASDGLWDAVHYNEVRDIVRRPDLLGNPKEATEALLKFGIDKSKERFKTPSCHDNITVIVAYYVGL